MLKTPTEDTSGITIAMAITMDTAMDTTMGVNMDKGIAMDTAMDTTMDTITANVRLDCIQQYKPFEEWPEFP